MRLEFEKLLGSSGGERGRGERDRCGAFIRRVRPPFSRLILIEPSKDNPRDI